jgi:hypothetical protein
MVFLGFFGLMALVLGFFLNLFPELVVGTAGTGNLGDKTV